MWPAQSLGGAILLIEAGRALSRQLAGVVAPLTLLVLWAASANAQNAPSFTGALDPLFQGDLTHPGHLNDTIRIRVDRGAGRRYQIGDQRLRTASVLQPQARGNALRSRRALLPAGFLGGVGSAAISSPLWNCPMSVPTCARKSISFSRDRRQETLPRPVHRFRPDRHSLSEQCQPGTGGAGDAGVGPEFEQRLPRQTGLEFVGTVGLEYVHDFEDQTATTFEASVLGYDAQQFTLHQFDIGLLEVRAGPRFSLAPGNANAVTMKPYLVATGALLADAPYSGGLGGGLTLHANIGTISSRSLC